MFLRPRSRPTCTPAARAEALEPRQMFSASLAISTAAVSGGTELRITGTPGNDSIYIRQSSAGITVTDGAGHSTTKSGTFKDVLIHGGAGSDRIQLDASVTTSAILYGGRGADSLFGGSGDDRLYGGRGMDALNGNAGDDTLVAIGGGTYDTLTGGTGIDSFWLGGASSEIVTDVSGEESAAQAVHRISSFAPLEVPSSLGPRAVPVPTQALTQQLPEPAVTGAFSYRDFSADPLFASTGPSPDDIAQGDVGDCYFLATLSAVAKTDPERLRQAIADLGDGTYAVRFDLGGQADYVRVDAELPTDHSGALAYARLGKQSSLWVALMEKAFAFFRTGEGTYQSIDGGWMHEAFLDLGMTPMDDASFGSATALLDTIGGELSAGEAVTYAVQQAPAGSPLLSDHAYMVDSVVKDAKGNATGLRLRNPWGTPSAGYLAVTAQQALAALWVVTAAE